MQLSEDWSESAWHRAKDDTTVLVLTFEGDSRAYTYTARLDVANDPDAPAELWAESGSALKPLELQIPRGALPESGRVAWAVQTRGARFVRLRAKCSAGEAAVRVEIL